MYDIVNPISLSMQAAGIEMEKLETLCGMLPVPMTTTDMHSDLQAAWHRMYNVTYQIPSSIPISDVSADSDADMRKTASLMFLGCNSELIILGYMRSLFEAQGCTGLNISKMQVPLKFLGQIIDDWVDEFMNDTSYISIRSSVKQLKIKTIKL